MKIEKEFRNDLLKRKEVEVVGQFDSNPGYANATKELASQFGVGEDVVVVRKIGSHFGVKDFVIDAFIYDSAEDKEKIEPRKKEKKK